MIRIRINVEGMRLEAEGHAGYAPAGQDIVCAAVSTLAYTLAQNLEMLCPEDYEAEITDGRARIEAHPPPALAEQCRGVFMVIANGLAMLEAPYGPYIQLEGD